MKTYLLSALAAVVAVALVVSGCAKTQNDQSEPAEDPVVKEAAETVAAKDGRALIVYFSKTGNTEAVANMIAERTGAQLYKVQTVVPYPEDDDETVDLAKKEQNENARPKLANHVGDMEKFDVIFFGYPNWWGTIPMAMFTFLEEYDLAGKTIIPFCTHGGGGMENSEEDIAKLAPDSNLLKGLSIRGEDARNAQADVDKWLADLGMSAE